MAFSPIGIHDIALYVPPNSLRLSTLVQKRVSEDPKLEKHLARALETTGQKAMRFPSLTEDTVTMAAEALRNLMQMNPQFHWKGLRFLTMGTETGVDMSKAGASYVLGLMQKSGFALPNNLSTFQIQHACAAGTLALMTVAGYLQAAGQPHDSAVVLTSDIARYKAPSTAEVTQGAGACAVVMGQNPSLLELDLASAGFASHDVDDFFRPLGSVYAKVKGGYSLACYHESLIEAFEDHCQRSNLDPAQELQSIDIFCLHVPYALMPVGAMEKLLKKYLDYSPEEARLFLQQRGFFQSLEPTAEIGNLYTGSLYLSLAFSLHERLQSLGPKLVGKKVLLASYGSGNTMVVLTGKVAAKAPETIQRWKLTDLLNHYHEPDFTVYQDWLDTEKTSQNYAHLLALNPPEAGRFVLTNLREDGYREYEWR